MCIFMLLLLLLLLFWFLFFSFPICFKVTPNYHFHNRPFFWLATQTNREKGYPKTQLRTVQGRSPPGPVKNNVPAKRALTRNVPAWKKAQWSLNVISKDISSPTVQTIEKSKEMLKKTSPRKTKTLNQPPMIFGLN